MLTPLLKFCDLRSLVARTNSPLLTPIDKMVFDSPVTLPNAPGHQAMHSFAQKVIEQ